MGESLKSRYKPNHPKKYKGDYKNIICRSSWERKFCSWCDLNENVLEWGSEEFWIPYRAPDGKVRRYFPDFIMKVKERKTYEVNQAKWKAAKEWCADRKIEFKIVTEKELGIR
jgi:hypothetical protein